MAAVTETGQPPVPPQRGDPDAHWPDWANPQRRRASCEGILNFAFARDYKTAKRPDSGCDE